MVVELATVLGCGVSLNYLALPLCLPLRLGLVGMLLLRELKGYWHGGTSYTF